MTQETIFLYISKKCKEDKMFNTASIKHFVPMRGRYTMLDSAKTKKLIHHKTLGMVVDLNGEAPV